MKKPNPILRLTQLTLAIATALGALPSAYAAVNVNQTLLTVEQKVAPNLLFILDDSGSMNLTRMPDDLDNTSSTGQKSPDVNGVYYNPTSLYTPPPKADGTFYPTSSFNNAREDGFNPSSPTMDINKLDTLEICVKVGRKTTCTDYTGFFYYTYNGSTGSCNLTKDSCFTRHVVSDSCTAFTNAGVDCTTDAVVKTNVANWYSYNKTRLNTAKSGTMKAFSTLNPTYRFGYGAINNDNISSTSAKAEVTVFGDGSSGTRKAEFWKWLNNKKASGATPTLSALRDAGEFYTQEKPWLESSSDPTEIQCRQSFTILTSDGYWNQTPFNIGNQYTNFQHTDISGQVKSFNVNVNPFKGGDISSSKSSMAQIAMKYWKTDLRDQLPNDVPTGTKDPAFWQHMTTFAISLGLDPVGIQPAGTTVDQIFAWSRGEAPAISGFKWPTPASNTVNNVADMAHAAVNGHGGFFSAKNPDQFASSLKSALKDVEARQGGGAGLAANSTQLGTNSVVYQGLFTSGVWTGDLKAFALDPVSRSISTTSTWSAANKLPVHTARNIKTMGASGAIDFKWATLTATQKTALNNSENLVNYLRGDASKEEKNTGGTYRSRSTPIGDIVHSQPVYVGAPNPGFFANKSFTGASAYTTFASDQASRSPTVYIAANDGMLHAFDAATGVEKFAYLPNAVILNGLKELADPLYEHKYFNDGEMTVADVYISGAWKSILVGTTGLGTSKVVYALDVTDPSSIKVLWEKSGGNIGQVSGKPVIVQTDSGWKVLLGNGYNSSTGKAALLQFDVADGSLETAATDNVLNNGLAQAVSWDVDNDGIQDLAFAGDLNGRVWKFDLASPTSAGTKLFTAKDATDVVQPITAGMLIGKDPLTGYTWVFFGTGKFLSTDDTADKQKQSWYGLIVDGNGGLVSALSSGRSSLVKRDITTEVDSATGLDRRAVDVGADGDMTGKSGWYMDLVYNGVAEGERMLLPNQFNGNMLIGTTMIPDNSNVCRTGGKGWIYAINPFLGTNPKATYFDVNGDGVADGNDMIGSTPVAGIGFDTAPNQPTWVGGLMLVGLADGSSTEIETFGGGGAPSRVSWHEIINQ